MLGSRWNTVRIESPGFLAAVRSEADLATVTADGPPAIAETAYRLHAACGFAHAANDAAREIGPLPADQISGVTIEVSSAGALLAGSRDPNNDADA